MAISRFQMNRQLRAYGGIMGQDGRRNYGIGSFFQKKIMDPIKKVVKSPVGKAAAAAALGSYGIGRMGEGGANRSIFGNILEGGQRVLFGKKPNIVLNPTEVEQGAEAIYGDREGGIFGGIKKAGSAVTQALGTEVGSGQEKQTIGNRLLGGIFGGPGLALASGLIAGAFTKDKEDPIYTGQDVGLNLQDIAKLANISDPKTAAAIGLRFSPDVASRKFTPEEMAATYAANAPQDFTEQRQGAEEGGIIGDQKDFEEFLQDRKNRNTDAMQDQILRDFQEYMRRKMMRDQTLEIKDGGIIKMADGGMMMASNAENDAILERLFEEYLELGFSPEDAAKKAREEFDRMGMKKGKSRTMAAEGGMMASAVGDESDEISMSMFGKPVKDLNPSEFQELMDYLDNLQKKFMAKGGIASMANGGPIDPDYLGIPPVGLGTGQRPGGAPFPNLGDYDSRGMMKKRNKKNKKKKRDKKAEGGMMNLGGMEMDLRGGGFVPMGRAEKADDVPARLSKNEFVFTADAVRAAGGGSVDKGADKMYATMKKLEDRVA